MTGRIELQKEDNEKKDKTTEPSVEPAIEKNQSQQSQLHDQSTLKNEIQFELQTEMQFADENINEGVLRDKYLNEQKTTTESKAAVPSILLPNHYDELLQKEIASIPDKLGFKIGDVAEMLGIKQYVLRYWETEFDLIRPKKARNNQRLYTKKDVENIYLIRKLLHRDRFSIEGAKTALKGLKTQIRKEKEMVNVQSKMDHIQERVNEVLADIRSLKKLLN